MTVQPPEIALTDRILLMRIQDLRRWFTRSPSFADDDPAVIYARRTWREITDQLFNERLACAFRAVADATEVTDDPDIVLNQAFERAASELADDRVSWTDVMLDQAAGHGIVHPLLGQRALEVRVKLTTGAKNVENAEDVDDRHE